MYSIQPILHDRAAADGQHKIIIRIIYNRSKIYLQTPYRAKKANWTGKGVTGPNAAAINTHLATIRMEAEGKIIALFSSGKAPTVADMKKAVSDHPDTGNLYDFIKTLQGELKLSEGRLRHYGSIANKIKAFAPDIRISQVNTAFLQKFDRSLDLDQNTVNSNMRLLKSILSKAAQQGLFDKKQIEHYKTPRYIQKIPDYLTEEEIKRFEKVVDVIEKPMVKTCGYYFLLSCYTGYRISDLYAFDYDKHVKDGLITIRAKKNKAIVSFLIYPALERILNYVKDHPLAISQQHMREYVREIAVLAGINRGIKVHTGRHTAAMYFMAKGFSKDDVAELLGDSEGVIKVYARVSNPSLNEKVKRFLL